MSQNISHAVMAQRQHPADDLDFFPTPGWGTRALCHYVVDLRGAVVWEPACGRKHMARALEGYAGRVVASDIKDYGVGAELFDFLALEGIGLGAPPFGEVDWVVTNPPFSQMARFIMAALSVARRGVAVLGRLQLLEGIDRYETIYKPFAGHFTVAPFVERLPMEEGCVARDTGSATAYAWLVIDKLHARPSALLHIPPCRSRLEFPLDYDPPEFVAAVRKAKAERRTAQEGIAA